MMSWVTLPLTPTTLRGGIGEGLSMLCTGASGTRSPDGLRASRWLDRATLAGFDQVVEGICTVLRLTPELRQRYTDVLVQAADDALFDLRLRQRIDDTLAVEPTPTNRLPAVVLELEDVLARIRSTGETRPEAAIGPLGHLLDAVRRHLRDLPDTEMLRAFCERLRIGSENDADLERFLLSRNPRFLRLLARSERSGRVSLAEAERLLGTRTAKGRRDLLARRRTVARSR